MPNKFEDFSDLRPNIAPGYQEPIDHLTKWAQPLKFPSIISEAYYDVVQAQAELDAELLSEKQKYGGESSASSPEEKDVSMMKQVELSKVHLDELLRLRPELDFISERTDASFDRLVERLRLELGLAVGATAVGENVELESVARQVVAKIELEKKLILISDCEPIVLSPNTSSEIACPQTRADILQFLANRGQEPITARDLIYAVLKKTFESSYYPRNVLQWLESLKDDQGPWFEIIQENGKYGDTAKVKVADGVSLQVEKILPPRDEDGRYLRKYDITGQTLYLAAITLANDSRLIKEMQHVGINPPTIEMAERLEQIYKPKLKPLSKNATPEMLKMRQQERAKKSETATKTLVTLLTNPDSTKEFLHALNPDEKSPEYVISLFMKQFLDSHKAYLLERKASKYVIKNGQSDTESP